MTSERVIVAESELGSGGPEYTLSPDAALILMPDGRGYVLDMGDRFYGVSAIGARMLCDVLAFGRAGARDRIAAEFDAPVSRIEADLAQLVGELQGRGVIRRRDEARTPPGVPAGARLLAGAVGTVFRLTHSIRVRATVAVTAARLSCKLFGWVATVAAWRRGVRAHEAAALGSEPRAARAIDDEVRNASARLPLALDCKERALGCWALARAAGLPASLVIGVVHYPLSGHCWCEVGTSIVSDVAENCARYTPVFRYA